MFCPKQNTRLPFFDAVVLCLTTAITILCALQIYGKQSSALVFVVQGKEGSWVYPTDRAALLEVPGPLGTTTVELKNGAARVIASPCANQSCVASGAVHSRGRWIACLPNGVFVSVEPAAANAPEPGARDGTNNGNEVDGALW